MWVKMTAVFVAALAFGLTTGCNPQTPEPAAMEQAAAMSSALIGHEAPGFTLQNQDGEPVGLQDFRGQWLVLYFYPKDDTPGCTCQATEFTGMLDEFQDMNAVVLGISEDSPRSHRRFIEAHDLDITLLSDPTHETMSDYGAWLRGTIDGKGYGRTIRSTVSIGPEGKIRYHWPEVIPTGHAERVRRQLKALQGPGS